jgi:hypothetical protein
MVHILTVFLAFLLLPSFCCPSANFLMSSGRLAASAYLDCCAPLLFTSLPLLCLVVGCELLLGASKHMIIAYEKEDVEWVIGM